MKIILRQTNETFENSGQVYLSSLYQALFASAYYGLLRVGEITESNHTIKAQDVQIGENKQKILFILRSSKTHGKYNKPQLVKIRCQDAKNDFCPFILLKAYIAVRPEFIDENENFFVFRDRTPVFPAQLNRVLRTVLKTAGFQEKHYSVHGFRGGRSQDLAELKVPIPTLMRIGRWKSNAIYKYLS